LILGHDKQFQKTESVQIVDLLEYSAKLRQFVHKHENPQSSLSPPSSSSSSSSSLVQEGKESEPLQLLVGRMMREAGPQWWFSLSLSKAIEQIEADPNSETAEMISDKYSRFVSFVESSGLLGDVPIWEVGIFFTGTNLIHSFGAKPGKQIGVYLQQIIDWQILNPGKTIEECRSWITTNLFPSPQ